ncbi:MAG TPA: chalcone isomerase family protein [Psychromonas sp.]
MNILHKNPVRKNALVVFSLAVGLLFFNPLYADVTAQLKTVGKGDLSWFLMDIYQASLHSADGVYADKKYPQALKIRYQRSFKKQWLVDATAKEWQKMAITRQQYNPWLRQLSTLWPDVKSGDTITFFVAENGQGSFYHNDILLGEVENPDLADAFLDIWLAKNTSQPRLRRQLIGE